MQPAMWRPSSVPPPAIAGMARWLAPDTATPPSLVPPCVLSTTPMLPHLSDRASILVIDDDTMLLRLLADAFADDLPDADVRLATSAHEGERAALAWTPDVIICDVHLPDDDGRHLLGRLRTRPRLARVPSVLMTGLDISSRLLREEAAALRADLLRKPFDLPDLLRLVGRALAGQVAI
jgi:CheY-like chemotaxis protein